MRYKMTSMSRKLAIAAMAFALVCAVFPQDQPGQATPAQSTQAPAAPERTTQEKPAPEQAAQSQNPPGAAALAAMSELERKTLALDIAVSNYYELRDMAVKYGLPSTGTSAELKERLYAYFGLNPPAKPVAESSVVIESASSMQYFSMEGSGEKILRLTGPLRLSITTSDGFLHSIEAREITFYRDENIVQADGDIHYVREGNGRKDEFNGSTILVDLDSYSGVFLDGSFNMEPSGEIARTLSFRFESILRRPDSILALENARVTGCDEVPPHYFIKARKAWLFDNGDWALAGATLYLGAVPVLWLPYFYYPSDEIIFHPVLGYRSRPGAFLQTTTYLIGEKKRDKDPLGSLSVFSSGSEAQAFREGLFIRRLQSGATAPRKEKTGEEGTSGGNGSPEKTPKTLKLIADMYSALGAYIAAEGSFPMKGEASLSFAAGIGISRSLFLESTGAYSPFDSANDYASKWNGSNFAGLKLPFRFGVNVLFKDKWTWGSAGLSLDAAFPLYSDPYFEQDFGQRAESTTLYTIADANQTAAAMRTGMIQTASLSFTWKAASSGAAAPSRPIHSISVPKLNFSMSWKTKPQATTGMSAKERRLLAADPQRTFFYPDSLKPLELSLNASGSILNLSRKKVTEAQAPAKGESQEAAAKAAPAAQPTTATRPAAAPASRDFSSLSYRMDWQVSGSGYLEDKFRSSAWSKPEDIDLALLYFLYSGKGLARITSNLDFAGGFLTGQTSVSASAQDQRRPTFVDERTSPTTVHPNLLSDYAYRSAALDASLALAMSPLAPSSAWSRSSLAYAVGGTVYSYKYKGLAGPGPDAKPVYKETWLGWDPATLTSHSLNLNFAFSPKVWKQKLALSANLPPQLEKYGAVYSVDSPYFSANLQAAVSRSAAAAPLAPSLLSARIVAGGKPYPALASDFSWDFEAAAPLSSVTSLSYGPARVSYTMKKSKGYAFENGTWTTDGTNRFRPYDVSLSVAPSFAKGELSSKDEKKTAEGALNFRVTPKFELSQNLVRFTESVLGVSVECALETGKGTALSFKSASSNKSAWRYWPGLFPSTAQFDPGDYYKNIFVDLGQSLSVWSAPALRASLFKLQGMSLSLAQDMHDWTAAAEIGMSPVLVTPDTGRPSYQLDFSFSLVVTWKDLSLIKSETAYEKGAFTR